MLNFAKRLRFAGQFEGKLIHGHAYENKLMDVFVVGEHEDTSHCKGLIRLPQDRDHNNYRRVV